MTKAWKAVLFDLDGTLLDTNELIIQSVLHAVKGRVPDDFGREHIIPFMGVPLAEQLRRFTGLEDVEECIRAYREYQAQLHDEMAALFPGAAETLPQLKAQGIKLAVVTNKMRLLTERALHMFGVRQYMDVIVTSDDVVRPKPDPEPVLKAIRLIGADPEHTLMVGDSIVDVKAAKSAGVTVAGVAWSLKGGAVLQEAGADLILDSLEQLTDLPGMRGASQ